MSCVALNLESDRPIPIAEVPPDLRLQIVGAAGTGFLNEGYRLSMLAYADRGEGIVILTNGGHALQHRSLSGCRWMEGGGYVS